MKRRSIAVFLAAAALLAACDSRVLVTAGTEARALVPAGPVLTGRVVLPPRFAVQSVEDLRAQAAVMLIDAGGTVRLAGTTDADGVFRLFRGTIDFVPQPGDRFRLEVTRRGSTGVLLALRTLVERTATGWRSLTGDTVVVNAVTTAVTQLTEQDPTLDVAALWGIISGEPIYDTVGAIAGHAPTVIPALVSRVEADLAAEIDPGVALPASAVVTGDVLVTESAGLAALTDVQRIDGDLVVDGTVTELILPKLTEVRGHVILAGDLETASFPALRRIDGRLVAGGYLYGFNRPAPALRRLDCPRLEQVWAIDANDTPIAELSGFGRLRSLGHLHLRSCPQLVHLPPMPQLERIEMALVNECPQLVDLASLRAVRDVRFEINLTSLPALPSLEDLAKVARIGHQLYLADLPVTNLSGLSALTSVASVELQSNPALVSLADLSSLQTVTERLLIQQNPLLTDISLPVTGVEGIEIVENASLQSLGNWPNLTQLGMLDLRKNAALAGLAAWPQLNSLGRLVGNQNPLLPKACVDALADRFPAASISVSGTDPAASCP